MFNINKIFLVVPRRKSNYRHMKRIFRENSCDTISNKNRVSLHESMLSQKPENFGRIEAMDFNSAEPTEIHESQRTPKPRRSAEVDQGRCMLLL